MRFLFIIFQIVPRPLRQAIFKTASLFLPQSAKERLVPFAHGVMHGTPLPDDTEADEEPPVAPEGTSDLEAQPENEETAPEESAAPEPEPEPVEIVEAAEEPEPEPAEPPTPPAPPPTPAPPASLADRSYPLAGIDAPAHEGPGCPICGSQEFQTYNGRENAHCRVCGSLERSRLLWLVLKATHNLVPGKRILHFAPEPFLMKAFYALSGDNYYPCDIAPENYPNSYCKVHQVDLCYGIDNLPADEFDLIIHNHVMEHVPCDYLQVLKALNSKLSPMGQHIFSVPFRGAKTVEDLSPGLSGEERLRRFGQSDHMRLFGRQDFPLELDFAFDGQFKRVDTLKLVGRDACAQANIPTQSLANIDGNSLFLLQNVDALQDVLTV